MLTTHRFKAKRYSILIVVVMAAQIFNAVMEAMPNSKDIAWSIVKISYNPLTKKAEGGICGSAFFVKDKVFLSANHCFNDSVFIPNRGYPSVKVFLSNSNGYIIENISIKELFPEYDLAIGELIKTDTNVVISSISDDFMIGDSVYNIGFPTDNSLIDYKLNIEGEKLIVESINIKQSQQFGKIEDILRVSVNSNDVRIRDKHMIKLDYSSKVGFSGGPLILSNSGDVIGIMSFIIPDQYDPNKSVMAIPISEILKILKIE